MLKKYLTIFIYAALFFFYLWVSVTSLDPDFGWHIRLGQYILQHGIPHTDPFSYTMPSYPFVDHEWLTNIFLWLGYKTIGMLGLACIFSGIAVLSLILSARLIPKVGKQYAAPFLFLSGVYLTSFVGVRPQLLDWLFFVVLLSLFQAKKYAILPILLFVWANLHGGFIIGVVVTILYIGVGCFEEKRIKRKLAGFGILAIIATLVNPYGIALWHEVWMQFSDVSLHWSIVEWKPLLNSSLFYCVWVLLVVSVLFLWRYKNNFSLLQKTIFIVLLSSGLSSIRNTPLWVFYNLSLAPVAISLFYKEITLPQSKKRFETLWFSFWLLSSISMSIQGIFTVTSTLGMQEKKAYPVKEVVYLTRHIQKGNIFAPYQWGGYFLWKLPGKKDFIDGRMPSWRWGNAPHNESNYIFEEYIKVVTGKVSLVHLGQKYQITTFVIPYSQQLIIPIEQLRKEDLQDRAQVVKEYRDLVNQKSSFPLFNKVTLSNSTVVYKTTFTSMLRELHDAGYREVFRGNVAVIYQKL